MLDLGDVSRRLVGEPVTVVLGRELFDSGRFLLDLEAGRFERLTDPHDPTGLALPLRDHRGIKQLPIQIEGVETWADFDLGNGFEMVIDFPGNRIWLLDSRSD